jgi:predicted alpha/beta-hydrolase family hydrolase
MARARETFVVPFGGHELPATRYSARMAGASRQKKASTRPSTRAPIVILAHGAGAPQKHPFMVRYAKELAARGIEVVTFDFLYTALGKRAPDKNDVLEATWLAVLAHVRARSHERVRSVSRAMPRSIFIGGKSMGGRIASQIAARSESELGPIAGVILLGYPLHPPGKPQQLRTRHLPLVRARMLFVQGTRDPFGGPDELAPHLAGLPAETTIEIVRGGDHSFAVLKRDGVPQDEVHARALDAIARFVSAEDSPS